MKKQTQLSLLKWSTLLCNRPITSLNDIQSTDTLILMLNKIQRLAFQQLYHLDERASNSASSILKCINSYYKKQLNCNVSELIDGLNIFKNPVMLWELMIGVAIKGKNRDANINVILQMGLEEQGELMLLVQEVIEKLNQYDMAQNDIHRSHLSDSSDSKSIRDRKPSQFSHLNSKRDQFLNQMIQQNQLLKQKNHQLHTELTQLKSHQQQLRRTYEDRLNHFKAQRYQFLQVLQAGSSTIESGVRARNKSQFGFRDSIIGSESKIMEDPLHELNISITGSLSDIAADMLNAVKNLKKQTNLYMEKASLLQDHNKDLKVSLNQLLSQNKLLKEDYRKVITLEKQLQMLRGENEQLIKNQTELIKMVNEVEEQKKYMRDMLERLKDEKNQLLVNARRTSNNQSFLLTQEGKTTLTDNQKNTSNLNPRSPQSNHNIDLMKAPSFILRQMSSQLQPQSYNLNQQISDIKNPALRDKYEKQITQLKEKNQKQLDDLKQKNAQLRQQNNQLKQMNKMLQKTIHSSMEKTQEIQRNIEQGYRALFDIRSSVIEPAQLQNDGKNSLAGTVISIKLPQGNNIWTNQGNSIQAKVDKKQQKQHEESSNKTDDKDSKIVQFYDQVKKTVQSYEQKQLLMIIEIESLKKQLHDVMLQKERAETKNNSIKHDNSHSGKNEYRQNRMGISPNYQYNFKKSQLSPIEQTPTELPSLKQDSVLMININISGPGGQKQQPAQNQQYSIIKSQVNKSPTKQQSHTNQQPQKPSPKSKRNKQLYPSQEFIQIQQGEQLNENEFANIIYAKKSQHSSVRGSIDQRIPKDNASSSIKKKNSYQDMPHNLGPGLLDVNMVANNFNMNRVSTISGIDLRFSKDHQQRRSYFARSGFYNESFIELSHKLQSQIQEDIGEMSQLIQEKSGAKYSNNYRADKHRTEAMSFGIGEQDNNDHNQDQSAMLQHKKTALQQKLQKIKSSYTKIKQFHQVSTQQVQSHLNNQQSTNESQLTKLKLSNQSLKHSLTLMITQKQLTLSQLKQLKLSVTNINSKKELEEMTEKFTQMLSSVEDLELILPELQLRLDNSRVQQLEVMYAREKYLRQTLQQEINLLMETILWFRNLAVDQEF